MQLSYNAAKLLKFVIGHTGEKETNEKGDEADSLRRLNGEESAQRRHYNKAIAELEKEVETTVKTITDKHNEKVAAKKELIKKVKGEAEEAFQARVNTTINQDTELVESFTGINKEIKELLEAKHDVELTDKVKEFVKKYFEEFGKKAGFLEGDDVTVEELQAVL